jgi:hypothetical protein
MMTCICAKLVSAAHANHIIKSHWIFFCVFLVLYLKTTSLNSPKIIKKSPITEYSDRSSLSSSMHFGICRRVHSLWLLGLFISISHAGWPVTGVQIECPWLGVFSMKLEASLGQLVCNDWGEPPVSYKWTGWVWEIIGRSSRLQENYRSFQREFIEYTPI